MREWIGPALATPGFVLELQPPAQPHRCVAIECPIRLADGAYLEVVRPSAQRAVHLAHQLCGFLPCPRSVCQCMDLLNHALLFSVIAYRLQADCFGDLDHATRQV